MEFAQSNRHMLASIGRAVPEGGHVHAAPRRIWRLAVENNVRHLVAKRLVDISHLLDELEMRSRDFQ